MNKNIVYCICSYLSNDSPMVTKLLPLIKDMETWAHAHNADFKLITRIPDVIEDMFSSITTIYKSASLNILNANDIPFFSTSFFASLNPAVSARITG